MLSLVEQLRAIAGVERDVNKFSIQRPSGTTVSVIFSPGTSESLVMSVAFPTHETAAAQRDRGRPIALPLSAPRPLTIKLSLEASTHVRAKEMGINREVQLGDPAFDGKVYINSPSGDDIIREVLSEPEVRATVRELLEHDASVIVLDDQEGRVAVYVIEFRQRSPDQTRAERMLEAMDKLARSLPAVSPTPGGRTSDWLLGSLILLGIVAFVGLAVSPLLYHFLSPDHCFARNSDGGNSLVCKAGPECCRPGLYGVLAGAGISVPLSIVLFFTVRGQSNSLSKMKSAIVISSVLLMEIGAIVGRVFWK